MSDQPANASAFDYVTIARASELSGYTEYAIRAKIHRGVWLEGRVWRRAPDGRILISLGGLKAWVESEPQYESATRRR